MINDATKRSNMHQQLIKDHRKLGYQEMKKKNENYAEQTADEIELLKLILEFLNENDRHQQGSSCPPPTVEQSTQRTTVYMDESLHSR
jgi:hypothetical protein